MTFKPLHLIILFAIGILLGWFLFSYTGKEIPKELKTIDSLHQIVKWKDINIRQYEDTIKVANEHIVAEHSKRVEAEKKADYWRLQHLAAKNLKPLTAKDSLVDFEVENVSCDSLVNSLNNVVEDLKSELSGSNKMIEALDTLTNNLKIENKDLKKIDSLHQKVEMQLTKKFHRRGLKAGIIGAIIALALKAII